MAQHTVDKQTVNNVTTSPRRIDKVNAPYSDDTSDQDQSDNRDSKRSVRVPNGDLKPEENLPLIAPRHDLSPRMQEEERPVLHVQFDRKPPGSPTIKTVTSPTSSISSSSSSSDSLDISEASPPDGGWGWVVVAASFVVNLIADGITFSFGVIFVEFLKYFGQNRGTTAWIGGVFMAMPLLSGPIASFLTDRYGCRRVTIFGSILASTGFIISSRANSMTVICITFGILAGFGLSLCYVASVVIVAYYFDKKRSFATGLAVCGSGIGTFIFAPFIQLLLKEYDWRGTTLILAGLFLNLAVCGAVMRDLPWTSKKLKNLAKERKRNRHLKRKNKGSSADSFSVSNSTNTASVLQPIVETNDDSIEQSNPDRLSSSLVNLPTYVRNGEKVPIEVIELLSQHKNVYNVLLANYPSLLTPSRSFSDSGRLNEAYLQIKPNPPSPQQPTNQDAAFLWWLKRNQISPPRMNKKLPTAYLKDLRVHRLSVTYRGAMLNINRYRLRASSCPDIYRNSMTTIAKEKVQWYAGLWDFWDLLVDMFDFSHFSDVKFLLFAISNFCLYTWYDVPYVYLTDHATTLGYTKEDASLLISIIGIVNMSGEVILGWAGDRPWANASIIYAVCMGLCGAVTALVPLINSYWALCVISGAFGFFIAANYSLTCIILVELITLDRFTNAYGLLLLVQGVANLIGPPLGGWLCDQTMNYNLSFYLAGLFIALSGLLLIILPLMKGYKRFMRQGSERASVDDFKQPKFQSIVSSCLSKTVQKPTTGGASQI
ncbi:monocarboxylate transporter 13 [Asbolus verrucosus]|uniref:Monocarboxylate transporter 13 n=1 Tax=Asbolus verrucosus TaxID=1661398 RepID=A0A482VYU5_ASBVE|nr:monocarboxylate transporter 13 [Asbolus verrucosus]